MNRRITELATVIVGTVAIATAHAGVPALEAIAKVHSSQPLERPEHVAVLTQDVPQAPAVVSRPQPAFIQVAAATQPTEMTVQKSPDQTESPAEHVVEKPTPKKTIPGAEKFEPVTDPVYYWRAGILRRTSTLNEENFYNCIKQVELDADYGLYLQRLLSDQFSVRAEAGQTEYELYKRPSYEGKIGYHVGNLTLTPLFVEGLYQRMIRKARIELGLGAGMLLSDLSTTHEYATQTSGIYRDIVVDNALAWRVRAGVSTEVLENWWFEVNAAAGFADADIEYHYRYTGSGRTVTTDTDRVDLNSRSYSFGIVHEF